jgi:hypothetical protein
VILILIQQVCSLNFSSCMLIHEQCNALFILCKVLCVLIASFLINPPLHPGLTAWNENWI